MFVGGRRDTSLLISTPGQHSAPGLDALTGPGAARRPENKLEGLVKSAESGSFKEEVSEMLAFWRSPQNFSKRAHQSREDKDWEDKDIPCSRPQSDIKRQDRQRGLSVPRSRSPLPSLILSSPAAVRD